MCDIFSPPLYSVRKYPLKYLIDCNFKLTETKDIPLYHIKQQDNPLFRQIRIITRDISNFNRWISFIDCKGGKSYEEDLSRLVLDGFTLKGVDFDISERSASMSRTGILSYVDSSIEEELDERVSLGITLDKTVLSKWYAYRGLMLSSCHCIENWYPKVVVVPDYYRTIKNQHIKYVYDKETEFIDKGGKLRKWTQKDITEGTRDIEINVFDGCGIHHPLISKYIQERIKSKTAMTSVLWRMPYIKGVTHEIDYVEFFRERGVQTIIDVWGMAHSVLPDAEPMIIITESMYKGLKYFKNKGDSRDWDDYWERFKRYDHCVGVAKWNFSVDEEPVYTRANYQILQDLDLPYGEFATLAKYSIDWVEKIINGDKVATMCFLGLFADKINPLNNYTKAIVKSPEMLKEEGVRNYLISLIKKYINDMKCGKLYLKGCFKFLAPDLIMLLEHIGGLPTNGCLNEDEFYSFDKSGVIIGERLIERNPHICKSEHVILTGVTNPMIEKYLSHLANVCMINGKSITPQRLNGADHDGDLVLVINNKTMTNGVDRNAPITIDIDDKITVEAESDSKENKLKIILRTMNSLIGETSNCATTYHNKTPKSDEQKRKYESFIDLLSVINGKAIDYSKTGVLFNIPRNIAKYAKPLPYFMKYASEYYGKQMKFLRSYSNMNRLCWEIEKWESSIRFKRKYSDFNYKIMVDNSIQSDEEKIKGIEEIYLAFCKEMRQLKLDEKEICTTNKDFRINWEHYYNTYRNKCLEVCGDICELANIAIMLCYEKYPKKSKKFIWQIAGSGVLQNLTQNDLCLPLEDEYGEYEYLGKKHNLVNVKMEENNID